MAWHHVDHVQPVVDKRAQRRQARHQEGEEGLQVGRAFQLALPAVPQAAEVGHVRDLHQQEQDGVDQVVQARREVEVHEQ